MSIKVERTTAPPPQTKAVTIELPAVSTSAKPAARNLLKEWKRFVRSNIAVVALFSVVINFLMLTLPIYLFQLSDRVLTSRSLDTLIMLSLVALGFILVLSLLDVIRRQMLARVATRMETMFAGPILAGLVGHAQYGAGNNIQALRSLHQVRSFIAGPVMLMLFDAPLAPIYFAAVFLIHPDLGFIVVGSAVALILTAALNQWATAGSLKESSVFASKADTQAEALARNSQVINAMGMLNEGIRQWGREQSAALTNQLDAQDSHVWISGLSKFLRLVTQIGMLGWGGYLALNGRLTGGMMIAASIIGGRALAPLEGMIEGWRSLVQTRVAYDRVRAMIEAVQNERPRLHLPKPQGRLSVDKLLHMVPGNKEPVLNGISFELSAGESLAIVGPSGSGKSTIARILVGCLVPTAGKVRLDATELQNWDRRQFGEYTGYLPQEIELFPGTIKANISRMRDDLPDSAVYSAAQMAGVHEVICHFSHGYETIIDGNGAPLSGGQRQRIALARAFFGNPSFVVLDEPNANLDAAGEEALAETFRRAKEQRITIVAVTQRPALLQSVDKVLVVRAGRAEAFGPPSEVLHRVLRQRPQTPAPQQLAAPGASASSNANA